jgi:protein-S-isoprenylcysteine O-methyltransferase Ste14
MQESMPQLESRVRFIAKISTGYFAYAVIGAVFAWYVLRHSPPRWLAILGAALVCVVGAILWAWTMRLWATRYRTQHKAFYSKLVTELLPVDPGGADTIAAQQPEDQAVTVIIGMYTVPQTMELILMDMYLKPANALVFLVFSLLILFSLLRNSWPPSFPRLLLAIIAAVAFNVVIVASAAIGMRRKLKKVWRSEVVVRLSNRGLEISQGAQSGSILPWASIDRVRETLSWILFMRAGRRIVAIPTSQVTHQRLGQLRDIVRAAKGQLADLKRL